MEVKNDLSKKVQRKEYTFNDNYWLLFEGEEYRNESDDIKQAKYEEWQEQKEKDRIYKAEKERRDKARENIELKKSFGASTEDFEVIKEVHSAVKKQFSLRDDSFKWTRWIIETKDICYSWENEDELKDFDDFRQQYHDCQEIKEEIFKKSENIVVEPVVEAKEPETTEPTETIELHKELSEAIECPSQASKPVFDTIVPIEKENASVASEDQEIISRIISELSFQVMTAEESEKYGFEGEGLEKLQYKFSELPKDPYRISLNEEMIISKEVEAVSLELLNGFCEGRRKLGKKRTVTREFIEMVVSNCIYYYNNNDICVSMSAGKNYVSKFGTVRSPNLEIKLINFLVSVGFINLVKGQSYVEAKKAGFKAELTKIKITPESFEKYSHIKEFIKDDSVFGCTVYARDNIKIKKDTEEVIVQDLRKYKMNAAGKRRYKATLRSVNNYNMLLHKTEISNNGEVFSYDRKKVKVVFGITESLDTKGRWCSRITNTKAHLRPDYLINGCKTIEKDYSCMHVSILMGINGHQIKEDFYKMNGYGEEFRDTIKKIVNMTLNMPFEQGLHSNLKRQMGVYEIELTEQYEALVQGGIPLDLHRMPGIPVPYQIFDNAPLFQEFDKLKLIRAVTKMLKDSPIKNELFTGKRINPKNKKGKVSNSAGMFCMAYEAAILERVINHFTAKGIVVLPVYDSCCIAQQYVAELVEVMEKAFLDEIGVPSAGVS